MAVELLTERGIYRLSPAAPMEFDSAAATLTLAMERADGIERIVIRCRVARLLLGREPSAEAVTVRLKPWLEREFERTREAALKAVRGEKRLHELRFDVLNRGPF